MLTAGSMRLSHSRQGSTSILQIMIVVATVLLVGATVLSAQTAPPANLANARAEEFTIAKITVLDTAAPMARPAFSRDGAWLAYVHNTGVPGKPFGIVIVSLPDGIRRHAFDFAKNIASIGWSPDGARILAVDDDRNGFVVDVGKGGITPIGRVECRWPSDEIIWAETSGVYFIAGDYIEVSSRFDLETLSASRISADRDTVRAKAAQLRKTLVDHRYVTLGTTRVGATFGINSSTGIAAINRDGSYTRVLVPGDFQTATLSPNASHAVLEYFGGQLRLLTMGTRQRPRLALEATLAPMPNPIQASDLAGIRASLAQGRIIYADVFRPRINPLNQRTVGAEGSSKGLVRIIRLGDDGNLEARFVREVDGYPATGDVLQTFWTPQPNQTEFRSVSAVVGPLRDLPASPIDTAAPKESATVETATPKQSATIESAVPKEPATAAKQAAMAAKESATAAPKVLATFRLANAAFMAGSVEVFLDDKPIAFKGSYQDKLEVGSTHVVRAIVAGKPFRLEFVVERLMKRCRVTPWNIEFYGRAE